MDYNYYRPIRPTYIFIIPFTRFVNYINAAIPPGIFRQWYRMVELTRKCQWPLTEEYIDGWHINQWQRLGRTTRCICHRMRFVNSVPEEMIKIWDIPDWLIPAADEYATVFRKSLKQITIGNLLTYLCRSAVEKNATTVKFTVNRHIQNDGRFSSTVHTIVTRIRRILI